MPRKKASTRKGSSTDGTRSTSPDRHVGIDNGLSGGWAVIDGRGKLLGYGKMPIRKLQGKGKTRREIDVTSLASLVLPLLRGTVIGAIEVAHAMPGQGVRSMFTFGQSYGTMRCFLELTCTEVNHHDPPKWQREIFGGKVEDTKKESLIEAVRLYPTIKIGRNHGISDAILIARHSYNSYGRTD